MPVEPNTNTLANHVADGLRRSLLARGLREGDLFMKEEDVARRYRVSRGIAREAVSQLRALGILKSRQARGLLVGRADPVELLSQSLPFYSRSPSDDTHIARFRYVLEIGAIELAVTHATEEQIDRLAQAAKRFESAASRARLADLSTADLAFHRVLLEMSNEPLVAGMHGVLADYFYSEIERGLDWDPADTTSQWQHHAIVQSVRQRDTEQSRALLRQHLRNLLNPPPADAEPDA